MINEQFVGIALIFFAIFLPNNSKVVFWVFQWIFAGLAVLFPFLGIVSAWKTSIIGLFIVCNCNLIL